jgi:hypothetical protein
MEQGQQVEVWFTHLGGDEPKYLAAGELNAGRDNLAVYFPIRYVDMLRPYILALWGISVLEPGYTTRVAYDISREVLAWPGGCYKFKDLDVFWLDESKDDIKNIVPYTPEIEVGIIVSRPDVLRRSESSLSIVPHYETEIRIAIGGTRRDLYGIFGLGYLFEHQVAGWYSKRTYEVGIQDYFVHDCKTTILDHLIAMGLFTDEARAELEELRHYNGNCATWDCAGRGD